MEEIWKDIKDYVGVYQVSNFGRVKSLPRIRNHGKYGQHLVKEKILNPYVGKLGYCSCTMRLSGIRKTHHEKVHRLVALHFIPNPLNLSEINHINGDKTNNHVDNLEWCTRSHNLKHAYKIGLRENKIGVNACNVKLTESQVLEIRNSNLRRIELAQKYNVSKSTIDYIIQKKTWKHI